MFSWELTPAIAARCLQHPTPLQWSLQTPSCLVGTHPPTGAASIRLQLPRVVAGLYPELEQALATPLAGGHSPLPRPPTLQHEVVLRVLHSLAQHAPVLLDAAAGFGETGKASAQEGVGRGCGCDGRGALSGISSNAVCQAGSVGGADVELGVGRAGRPSEGPTTHGASTLGSPPLTCSSTASSMGASSSPPRPGLEADGRCARGTVARQDAFPSSAPHFSIGSQLVVLLSADSAALGMFREGRLVLHKVLTGYTVRRKRGKAQATYQRQGGGACSVGGAIRARETRRLFGAVAERLRAWGPHILDCAQLYRGGCVRAWNELYSHAVPVARGDGRWRDAGVSGGRPRLRDLRRLGWLLQHGELSTEERGVQGNCPEIEH